MLLPLSLCTTKALEEHAPGALIFPRWTARLFPALRIDVGLNGSSQPSLLALGPPPWQPDAQPCEVLGDLRWDTGPITGLERLPEAEVDLDSPGDWKAYEPPRGSIAFHDEGPLLVVGWERGMRHSTGRIDLATGCQVQPKPSGVAVPFCTRWALVVPRQDVSNYRIEFDAGSPVAR